jgi:hypothetical protein
MGLGGFKNGHSQIARIPDELVCFRMDEHFIVQPHCLQHTSQSVLLILLLRINSDRVTVFIM